MSDVRQRILVVDDQAGIRELAELVLQRAGFDVHAAGSGAEALAWLGGESCGLVLLDISMPGMDGWETLRLIRADDALAALPVVMFSIKGELRDKLHALQRGATDYVTKPFQVDELVARVRRVLERAPARRAGSAGA
ncbi:MAG TPA: response regulator [Candidatus Polarisedimenticolaceae bacterium]|nr:response regulator [Candidatus Polarisedimenticolaceae bacterium]